jgi:hypothetical protein
LERVIEAGLVPVRALSPVSEDEIPTTLAAVGTGVDGDGNLNVVAVSPDSGAAAWLGGFATALRLAHAEGFRGRVWALSPRWRAPARALLGAAGPVPFEVSAVAIAAEGADAARVESEAAFPVALSGELAGVGAHAPLAAVQSRSVEALRGLAAKHGGVLQRDAGGLRLVLMGQPVAVLRHTGDAGELELLRPRRERIALRSEGLSEAFDQLEGSLRKVLADRKNRDGEPGMRARESAAFARMLGLDSHFLWPVGWGEQCPVDVLGVSESGQLLAGALRRDLDLVSLLPILEAAACLEPVAAWLSPGARSPASGLAVRVAALAPAGCLYELGIRSRAAATFELRPPEAPVQPKPAAVEERATPREDPATESAPTEVAVTAPTADEAKPTRRFEEMSLFDLSDDDDNDGERGGRRRRRRGGRGRTRSATSSSERESESAAEPTDASPEESEEAQRARRPRRRRRRRRARPLMVEDVAEEEVDEEEIEEEGVQSGAVRESGGGSDTKGGSEALDREDDASEEDASEEDANEEDANEEDVEALEEEAASAVLETPAEELPEQRVSRPIRRRAAIVAHADPISIGAAVLLARDLRLLEGIWVYNQDELMTFFRSVGTDLGEATSIFLIGFTATPVRETLQTASLYRERITWFDHHEWPPEDAEALRQAIGAESVHLAPGAGSSLPLVATECTRRSRFSDKFLDLLTGRFSPHDYERWGRLWWWRLVELAKNTGERRRDLDALLTGRPSDLAREAASQAPPPLPPEAEFVAGHDLPLVHFGGYTMLRITVPAGLDLLLTSRIARERYGAQLAVASHEGDRVVVLVGDDTTSRRGFDLGAMAEHLAAKFSWVESLPNADHVTRFRVVDLLERPERIEEVVAEVAMGRSVLEG